MSETIVLVTGGFDPLHSGHISLFKAAKELIPDAKLAVGVNTNEWLEPVSYTHLRAHET